MKMRKNIKLRKTGQSEITDMHWKTEAETDMRKNKIKNTHSVFAVAQEKKWKIDKKHKTNLRGRTNPIKNRNITFTIYESL